MINLFLVCQFIDILLMLCEKMMGNFMDEEEEFFENLFYDFCFCYIEKTSEVGN